MDNFMRENERLEDLGIKGLKIIQNSNYFCFGIDAVLLTWFASRKIYRKTRVVDLGTGTGIIPLLLYGRKNVERIEALEIQEQMVEMARRSVKLNGLEEVISIYQGDLKTPGTHFESSSYDVVVCNPPYMKVGRGEQNATSAVAIARHEILCGIEDVACFAKQVLKDRGRLFLVHKADRLGDIIYSLRSHNIEVKRLRFVQPFVDKEANLVLVEGMKCGKPSLIVEPPLIVYNPEGGYREEINTIYGTPGPVDRIIRPAH